jgi:hypothetical protein
VAKMDEASPLARSGGAHVPMLVCCVGSRRLRLRLRLSPSCSSSSSHAHPLHSSHTNTRVSRSRAHILHGCARPCGLSRIRAAEACSCIPIDGYLLFMVVVASCRFLASSVTVSGGKGTCAAAIADVVVSLLVLLLRPLFSPSSSQT